MSEPLRLVKWDEVYLPEKPYWDQEEDFLGRNLACCLYFNPDPEGNVTHSSIKLVELVKDDGYMGMGDADFEWDVTLKDGRKFNIKGWHDYTGWDCQSDAEYKEMATNE